MPPKTPETESKKPPENSQPPALKQDTEEDSSSEEEDNTNMKGKNQEEKMPAESKISKTLSERTTKTVIILILLMLFLLPWFSEEAYVTAPTINVNLKTIETIYKSTGKEDKYYLLACESFVDYHKGLNDEKLVRFIAPGFP